VRAVSHKGGHPPSHVALFCRTYAPFASSPPPLTINRDRILRAVQSSPPKTPSPCAVIARRGADPSLLFVAAYDARGAATAAVGEEFRAACGAAEVRDFSFASEMILLRFNSPLPQACDLSLTFRRDDGAVVVERARVHNVATLRLSVGGERLRSFLRATNVQNLWLPYARVDWRTGVRSEATEGPPQPQTHCSAYVAAVAERLGVRMLNADTAPNGAMNLSKSQARAIERSGEWLRAHGAVDAQERANAGALVLGCFSPAKGVGHIFVVTPRERVLEDVLAAGVALTQAGFVNAFDGDAQAVLSPPALREAAFFVWLGAVRVVD
jgi:hypothetical protein